MAIVSQFNPAREVRNQAPPLQPVNLYDIDLPLQQATDQGGYFETSRPIMHTNPIYEVDGITHDCGQRAGGGPDHLHLRAHQRDHAIHDQPCEQGRDRRDQDRSGFTRGLNVSGGHITYKAVAEAAGADYVTPEDALGIAAAA